MPRISQHHSQQAVKMLLMGDSGTGKTGALLALAEAGYNLRIMDFDNGLDIISTMLKYCKEPEAVAERICYATFTDDMKTTRGGEIIPAGQPKAFPNAMKMLNHWKDDDVDLGPVAEWGSDDVLVIDSLTFLSNAIMRWHLFSVGRLGQPYQQDWLIAQRKVTGLLEYLYSESLRCNVIINAHIRYVDLIEGESAGYPESVGKALPPQIPRFFNSVVQSKIIGSGKNAKQRIRIVPSEGIGLKMAAPKAFQDAELDRETALPSIFKAIRGEQ